MKIQKPEKEVIENPFNNAAIYARISGNGTNDTSIGNQIKICEKFLFDKGLMLYRIYYDKISASQKPLDDRAQLENLLEDAKKNKFKTIVVFKIDRLVRSIVDWSDLKQLFSRYDITVYSATESCGFSPNPSPMNTFSNLAAFSAELEAPRIRNRTETGRKTLRENGAYALSHCPFGYEISKTSISIGEKLKSAYKQNPILISFINFIFVDFYLNLNSDMYSENKYIRNTRNALLSKTYDNLNRILSEIKDSSNPSSSLDGLLIHNTNTAMEKTIHILISEYHNKDNSKFMSDINKAFDYFFSSRKKLGPLITCLSSPIYGGYMLKNPHELNKGLKSTPNGDIIPPYSINEDAFVKLINLDACVEYSVFTDVYCYMQYFNHVNKDISPDYLLKGKLKCSCGKPLILIDNMFLSCKNPDCPIYYERDLMESIFRFIVKDCIIGNPKIINLMLKKLDKKINKVDKLINVSREKTLDYTAKYAFSQSASDKQNILLYKNKKIAFLKENDILHNKRTALESLLCCINSKLNLNESISKDLDKVSSDISHLMLLDESSYKKMLNMALKEIRITPKKMGGNNNVKIDINYGMS